MLNKGVVYWPQVNTREKRSSALVVEASDVSEAEHAQANHVSTVPGLNSKPEGKSKTYLDSRVKLDDDRQDAPLVVESPKNVRDDSSPGVNVLLDRVIVPYGSACNEIASAVRCWWRS